MYKSIEIEYFGRYKFFAGKKIMTNNFGDVEDDDIQDNYKPL